MAIELFEIDAPPHIVAAFDRGKRCSFGIETVCPDCGKGPRDLKLRFGILTTGPRAGKPWWGCMRCHCEKRYAAERWTAKLRIRHDPEAAKADAKRLREWAMSIWECTSAIRSGDPVDRYLREQRKLRPLGDAWPVDLRWARLRYKEGDRSKGIYHCMVAAVRSVSGEFMAIHRTYLMEDGLRADDKSLPDSVRVSEAKKACAPVLGGAIHLGAPTDALGVAEGIETAIAFSMRTTIPCWSTISSVGMRLVRIPPEIKRVIIGPDIGDKEDTGFDAAIYLQKRLQVEAERKDVEIIVEIMTPPLCEPGDWADWVKKRSA